MPDTSASDDPRQLPDEPLALRMLYDEQTRLRTEVDQLRQQQEQSKEKGQDDESKEEDKENGKDKNKQKEQKPPLTQRVRAWVREHPQATLWSVIGLIVLIIVAALLIWYLGSYENTDDAFVDGHTDPITPRINGLVTAIYVENTYRVKKGQLLVELDPRDYRVAKEQADASLRQAEASARAQEPNVPLTGINQSSAIATADLNVTSSSANLAAMEERYRSALADLHEAEANHANAAREEQRYHMLVVKEEVSNEQYDQRATQESALAAVVSSRQETATAAQKAVDQARAQLGQAQVQARRERSTTPQQLSVQRSTLAQRRASILEAKAQADQAELNLQYTRIYAPEDGIIGDKQVQRATQVAPGQELFALTETRDIWVTANFKETQIRKMFKGQTVKIHVDALDEDFDGYVEDLPGGTGAIYSLLPPENATGNYVKVVQRLPVRIRFRPNQRDGERLAPGMSVEPKVWLR